MGRPFIVMTFLNDSDVVIKKITIFAEKAFMAKKIGIVLVLLLAIIIGASFYLTYPDEYTRQLSDFLKARRHP